MRIVYYIVFNYLSIYKLNSIWIKYYLLLVVTKCSKLSFQKIQNLSFDL